MQFGAVWKSGAFEVTRRQRPELNADRQDRMRTRREVIGGRIEHLGVDSF